MNEYAIGEVATMARVSVRALHHYDDIGLLRPSGRSNVGYRLYSATDLTRLHQIMSYRELGFGLGEIAEILADPTATAHDHLRRQHRLLRTRRARDKQLLAAIEHHMEAQNMGISLTPEQQFEVFGTTDFPEQFAALEKQWGETEWWQEASRRAAAYTYEDWTAINDEATGVARRLADALRAGEPADGEVATALAEENRQHLSRWFFACDHAAHRRYAERFLSGPGLTPEHQAVYESFAPGFAHYMLAAVAANAERAAKS